MSPNYDEPLTTAGFYCEDNIYDHCYGAGEVGVNGMPPNVEMVYTDIGDEVIAGRDLSYCADYDNPCRDAAEHAESIISMTSQ